MEILSVSSVSNSFLYQKKKQPAFIKRAPKLMDEPNPTSAMNGYRNKNHSFGHVTRSPDGNDDANQMDGTTHQQ
ncbi:hypothetical protein CEXT_104841 [Caerostris extrusa]|uniref:Uncharacterized protein n=1 Tax=Caerostris extrusa TaxID=172846 RepID=A0AAV4XVX2_CAEEX|nr:hypothetical protein CEXT_104841 [Caerostris extrusa]